MIKDDSYEIFSKGVGFDDLVNSFKQHESTIFALIENAEDDDFNLRTPEWDGENYQKLKRRGTLAWKIYLPVHATPPTVQRYFSPPQYLRV